MINRILNKLENGKSSVCPYIPLAKEELKYYKGCGSVIIAEQNGFIYDLIYIVNDLENNVPKKMQTKCIREILSNIPLDNTENVKFWLATASCYELCNPIQITEKSKALVLEKLLNELQ